MKRLVMGRTSVRRLWPLGVLVVACISLVLSYFVGDTPTWVDKIEWLEQVVKQEHRRAVLFGIELLAWLLVAVTSLFLARLSPSESRDALPRSEVIVVALILVSTLGYTWWRVKVGDEPVSRWFYALFAACLLVVWLRNCKELIRKTMVPFKMVMGKLHEEPARVFSNSREISWSLNSAMLTIIALLLPLGIWIPTLLPGPLSPMLLGLLAVFGAAVGGMSAPLYGQLKISEAVRKSMLGLDAQIAREALKPPTTKEQADRVKTLIEVRKEMVQSVRLPLRTILVAALHAVATVLALLAAYKSVFLR